MSKRGYPFDDNMLPQLKVHVGERQVCNGVNKKQEMKKVYEKTLSMLMKGRKEFDKKLIPSKAAIKTILCPEKKVEATGSGSAYKQMILSNKLELRVTDKDLNLSDKETCVTCKTTAVQSFTRCAYCNDFKCTDCLKECTICLENFCDKCSFIVYEGKEHTECLECYH